MIPHSWLINIGNILFHDLQIQFFLIIVYRLRGWCYYIWDIIKVNDISRILTSISSLSRLVLFDFLNRLIELLIYRDNLRLFWLYLLVFICSSLDDKIGNFCHLLGYLGIIAYIITSRAILSVSQGRSLLLVKFLLKFGLTLNIFIILSFDRYFLDLTKVIWASSWSSKKHIERHLTLIIFILL
jgi:hypothetical protein